MPPTDVRGSVMKRSVTMVRGHKIRRIASNVGLGVFFGLALVYFSYQALTGDYGTVASARYSADVRVLKAQTAQLERERDAWRVLTNQLGADGTFDKDKLDELVRQNLGYLRQDEIVIILPSE